MSKNLLPNRQYRIVVIKKCDMGYNGHPYNCTYAIIIEDVNDPGKSVDDLHFPLISRRKEFTGSPTWKSEDTGEQRLSKNEDSLARTIKYAVEQSRTLAIPFNKKEDVVLHNEFYQGPHQVCLSCGGEGKKRSRMPYVCELCVQGARIQRESTIEGQPVDVLVRHLAESGYVHDPMDHGQRILSALAALLRQPATSGERYSKAIRIGPDLYDSSNSSSAHFRFTLGDDQVVAMRELVQAIHDASVDSYKNGCRETDSMLVGVATGQRTLSDYDDRLLRSMGKK